VTGSGTVFTDERIAVGARIGFGSTDPTQISTWYVISAISDNITITISSSAGTINAGSSYVIEELRFAITATNATAANGGLHLVKGVNYSDFTTIGSTTIPAATTTDSRLPDNRVYPHKRNVESQHNTSYEAYVVPRFEHSLSAVPRA
jgi:hypothetical protein